MLAEIPGTMTFKKFQVTIFLNSGVSGGLRTGGRRRLVDDVDGRHLVVDCSAFRCSWQDS